MAETLTLTSETAHEMDCKTHERDRKNSTLKIEWRADGKLWASQNGRESVVLINQCFPWSEPLRYFSLRDDDENEVALIAEPGDLDNSSRNAVERALAEAGFVLEINGVDEIKEDYEIRNWKVRTKQGKRTFQTMLDDWPLMLPTGSLLLRDVAGDLFLIEDPNKLDERSRQLIWAFVG